jgi:methylenetetrahydrofolate dehydrogenase (NADP+)/methenyltetrahydrofolate cyclohydrolase
MEVNMLKNIKEYVIDKKDELREAIRKLPKAPVLAIIQVGNVDASNRYVKHKIKDCEEVGIITKYIHFEDTISEYDLLLKINQLNKDPSIHGFIVQMPLPKHIREYKIMEAISPMKDVDGFSRSAKVNPGTPQGIIDYLEDCGFDFNDKNAVVIGRSRIVGAPMSRLLLNHNCNVRIIHSKTSPKNRRIALYGADLIVSATGHRNTLIDEDCIFANPGCIVIDVGINVNDEGKLCGDCENLTTLEKTTVPGGCGLLTRVTLLSSLLKLYKMQCETCED